MRRTLVLFAVLALAACESPVTAPEASPDLDRVMARGGNGNGNAIVASVTGAGHFDIGGTFRRTSVTARVYADGSVKGQIEWHRNRKVHAEVTCLTVVGNRAYVGATVTKDTSTDDVGGDMMFIVEDNGQGANDPADRLSLAYVNISPVFGYSDALCALDTPPTLQLESTLMPIEQGNFQVSGG